MRPVFLSSSYLTLLPFDISMTCKDNAMQPEFNLIGLVVPKESSHHNQLNDVE